VALRPVPWLELRQDLTLAHARFVQLGGAGPGGAAAAQRVVADAGASERAAGGGAAAGGGRAAAAARGDARRPTRCSTSASAIGAGRCSSTCRSTTRRTRGGRKASTISPRGGTERPREARCRRCTSSGARRWRFGWRPRCTSCNEGETKMRRRTISVVMLALGLGVRAEPGGAARAAGGGGRRRGAGGRGRTTSAGRVELSAARIAVADLQFSILGEMHEASAWWPSVGARAGVGASGAPRRRRRHRRAQWRVHPRLGRGRRMRASARPTCWPADYNGLNFTLSRGGGGRRAGGRRPAAGAHGLLRRDGAQGEQAVAFTAQARRRRGDADGRARRSRARSRRRVR
jgi:hypothetical protein